MPRADAQGSRGRAGIEELLETHSTAALRFAYLLTGDREVARDVAQDAFVRLFGRFKDRTAPQAFEGYLRKTIANLCKDRWRRRRKARGISTDWRSGAGTVELPAIETTDELWTALNRLPVRQRTALVLRYYEDMSEVETATLLGCSVGAVKGLVTRGTDAMRRQLEGSDS